MATAFLQKLLAGLGALLWLAGSLSMAGQICAPPLLIQAKGPLENRFSRATISPRDLVAGIVVPGGSVERMREALRLAQRFPQARVILTGPHYSEVHLAAAAFAGTNRLSIAYASRNTLENAVDSKLFAQPQPGERWLLVTSALHMPRAMGTFARQGFAVEPWPVDDAHPMRKYTVRVIAWELAALVAYRFLGLTPALFPSTRDLAPASHNQYSSAETHSALLGAKAP